MACELKDDPFEGFKKGQIELILAGNTPTVGKSWVRTARFEDGQSVDFGCDSSNIMRIRNVAESTTLKDSVYFTFNASENCELGTAKIQKQGTWRLLPTGTVFPIDSIIVHFKTGTVLDTLRASIDHISPTRLQISYNWRVDSVQVKNVEEVFEELIDSE